MKQPCFSNCLNAVIGWVFLPIINVRKFMWNHPEIPSGNQTWQWKCSILSHKWRYFNGKITYKWWIFHCHIWLLQSKPLLNGTGFPRFSFSRLLHIWYPYSRKSNMQYIIWGIIYIYIYYIIYIYILYIYVCIVHFNPRCDFQGIVNSCS